MLSQIFNIVNIGLVVIDDTFKVTQWNRWMSANSGVEAEDVIGKSLFKNFPDLDNPRFNRNCKSVLAFGNFCYFSQKLHTYLFPMKPIGSFISDFDLMQQSCTMGPLRNEDNQVSHIFMLIEDVTEMVSYERKLLLMTQNDALTGVHNRRFLEEKLLDEIRRSKRYNIDLSVIMLDIDFFKRINDVYGHQHGDFVLKALADNIGSNTRKTDFLTRYGGEEFCLILTDTNLDAAMSSAEQIRKNIEALDISYKGIIVNLTVSLGVAALEAGSEDVDELLDNADTALYQAKNSGRNKVVVFE